MKIPVIESFVTWLNGQEPQLECTISEHRGYVNLHQDRKWMGVVTLIFPDQDQRQGLQHDWYSPQDHWPLVYLDKNSRYYRNVWRLADPSSFTEILATIRALRDGSPVKWHEVYLPSEHGIQLVERNYVKV